MKQKLIFSTLILAGSLTLVGCASNADINQMTSANKPVEQVRNHNLVNNIAVEQVIGGKETNPLWTSQINNTNFKEALIRSLKIANLYQDVSGAKYKLDANLIKLGQPLFGFNLTVDCQVHYSLLDVQSNRKIFDKDITTSYTAKLNDSLYAPARLKIANEGAARKNIQEFIKEIYQLPRR